MSARAAIVLLGALAVLPMAGCGESGSSGETSASQPTEFEPPPLYAPSGREPYANGKRLAGRVAQRLATFEAGADATDLARSVRPEGMSRSELAEAAEPLLHDGRSQAEVEYVQLSGVTESSLGGMVVLRQLREDADPVTRVFDVRLIRSGGPWRLDRIASVGGEEVERPEDLSPAAEEVLDDQAITLPDSARWDIYSGRVDDELLRVLSRTAKRWPLDVTVFRTGHPPNVWETNRRSAHTSGNAVDIFAVDGRLVLDQSEVGRAAYRAAESFVAGGAAQVGSPWLFAEAGAGSFTDEVHQDHLHLQQTEVP